MLVFGGSSGQISAQLSLYDLLLDQWSVLEPESGISPPPRSEHSAIWDPMNQALLIFAGQGAPVLLLFRYFLGTGVGVTITKERSKSSCDMLADMCPKAWLVGSWVKC